MVRPGSLISVSLTALLLGAAPAAAQMQPFDTAQCFAFWRLFEKLQKDGVPALLKKDPQSADNKPSDAEMERIRLYIDLEERLAFRCPDFAPPPPRHPDRPPRKKKPPAKAAKKPAKTEKSAKTKKPAKPAPPLPTRRPRLPKR